MHCAQSIEYGGLRDKPGKPRDFYHSCYALSGLSISQCCVVSDAIPIIQPDIKWDGSRKSSGDDGAKSSGGSTMKGSYINWTGAQVCICMYLMMLMKIIVVVVV